MEPDHIRYNPATGYGHDFLYTQVTLMPVPQRGHGETVRLMTLVPEPLARRPYDTSSSSPPPSAR